MAQPSTDTEIELTQEQLTQLITTETNKAGEQELLFKEIDLFLNS